MRLILTGNIATQNCTMRLMPDQKPTPDDDAEERLRRRKGALAGAVLVVIIAVLMAGMSANFHVDVGETISGPATATRPIGGVTTYNYHLGVIEQPRFWYQVLVFTIMAVLLCSIYVNYRRGNRKH